MSGPISRSSALQTQHLFQNMYQKSSLGGRVVLAGVQLPVSMRKGTGFDDWIKILDNSIAADGYILYAKDYESLESVASIQQAIKKPVIVRYTVGTMKKQQLVNIRDRANELAISAFFFVQGEPIHKFSDLHTGVEVADALDIFAKDQNMLLACEVPMPCDRESEYVAKKQFANYVEQGCNLGILPHYINPRSSMEYLSLCGDKFTLPAIIQSVSVSSSKIGSRSKKMILNSSAALLGDSLAHSKKRVKHLGALVDLSVTDSEDVEEVMTRMKGVSLASTMD